jgi:cysteinyl-tRNA synthetase
MGSASRPDTSAAPAAVLEAAQRRSDARAARDWATADELRAEIEAAGWRVTDSGTAFRLEPAHPADVEHGGEIRYGRSDAVPSRLDEAPTGVATVVLTVELGDPSAINAVTAAALDLPADVDLVVVGDGIGDATAGGIHAALDGSPIARGGHELVRLSQSLGRGAALNAGIRRTTGAVVVVLDTSIQPTGDIVSPLVAALEDPEVAAAGPFGLSTEDLRGFQEVVPGAVPVDVAAVQGYCLAFRRADAVERGPLDEGFRFYRNLDIWWNLVLRDAGEDGPPRRAIAVPDLPLVRGEPWAWTSTSVRERDRLSKRNFYRVLDSFRDRLDLAVPAPGAETGPG